MNITKGKEALVLHSGGIDSTTCLFIARLQFEEVFAISIDYGQRHSVEARVANQICRRLNIEHTVIKVSTPPQSMLTDPLADIPDASYEELPSGVSPTYVPFRNGLLLSTIAGYAQARGSDAIFFGAHAEDAQNWAYPDCTPEFIGAMANAIYIGTYHKVRLHTPLQWLMKHEIVSLGHGLGVPLSNTWSCYAGGQYQCGTCPTCRARKEAFIKANVIDDTIYAKPPSTSISSSDDEIPF